MGSGYAMINKEISRYLTILTLYEQQKYMYDNKTHSVEFRVMAGTLPESFHRFGQAGAFVVWLKGYLFNTAIPLTCISTLRDTLRYL